MDRWEISPLGGLARAASLTPERRIEIARRGFEALTKKRFGGVRRKAVEHLKRTGAIGPAPASPNQNPPDAEARLRRLHEQITGKEATHERPPGGTRGEDAG